MFFISAVAVAVTLLKNKVLPVTTGRGLNSINLDAKGKDKGEVLSRGSSQSLSYDLILMSILTTRNGPTLTN